MLIRLISDGDETLRVVGLWCGGAEVHTCTLVVRWTVVTCLMTCPQNVKMGIRLGDYGLCTAASCSCVIEGNGLWPGKESINCSEEVRKAIGRWQWSYEIHMKVIISVC